MQVRFIGNPHDPTDTKQVLEAWGKVFVLGEAVDISDLSDDMRRRISRNSHFEVVSDAPPAKRRGRPPKVKAEEVDDSGEENGDVHEI